MSCTRYAADLADAVAGETPAAPLADHLQGCETCQRRLEDGRRVLAALDRDLGDALAIEPSAALLAGVKERVARREPASVGGVSGTSLAWRIAATLMVAAGAAGMVWLLTPAGPDRMNSPSRAAEASPSGRVDLPGPPPSVGAAPTGASGSEAPVAARPAADPRPTSANRNPPPSRTRRVTTEPIEPEVIVPAGEAVLLARFVTILRTRTVEPSSLLVARSDEGLPELKAIDVSPLVIHPLSEDLEPADDERME